METQRPYKSDKIRSPEFNSIFAVNGLMLDLSTGLTLQQAISQGFLVSGGSHPAAVQYSLIHLVYTHTGSFAPWRKSVTHVPAALSVKYWSLCIFCMSSQQILKSSNEGSGFLCRSCTNATGLVIDVLNSAIVGWLFHVMTRLSQYSTVSETTCRKKCKRHQKFNPNLSTKVLSYFAPL